MPSPATSSSTSVVRLSSDSQIDALLAQVKWGGAVGTGASLTFSFPWTTNSSALFSGYDGATYSSLGENTAAYRFGLNATQPAAATGALRAWANVANISFSEVTDTSSSVGDIRFGWTSATESTSTGNEPWGWAYYPNAYWPSGGDIWISTLSSGASASSWAVGSYNYMSLIHEIGHAIGLKHTFEDSPTLAASLDTRQYSVMSYTDAAHSLFVDLTQNANGSVSWRSYNVQPETPMVLDIAAMQYIYGPNLGHRTGDDVYTFDPATPFLKTIWDAGGNDTISVANFSRGSTIDLRPGHYSSIAILSDSTAGYNWTTPPPTPTYDGTDNLGIAYNAMIENAVGGAGSDVLRGNDVANHLDGGAGNDVLYGGAGNDFFDWDATKRGGTDVFYGGTGDDQFVLTPGDQVIEYADEGADTVYVSMSYTLGDNLENLFLLGSAGLALTGNVLDNLIKGGAGNDTISGGAGNDVAVYDRPSSEYVIVVTSSSSTLSSTASGNDVLYGVEFAQFSDKRVALIDTVAPTLVALNPADESTRVAIGTNVVLTFSEAIQRGTGSIVLKTAAGTVVATYDAASSANVSISGSTLTINPSADLSYSTSYKVEFASGSIKDLAGNSYSGTADYNFTTAAPPDLIAPAAITFSPADAATGVTVESNVVVTFSEPIQRGTGSIILKTAAGVTVETYNAATSANLSISGSTLTISPGADLSYGTGYKVEFAAGTIKDPAGNSYAGTTSYDFATIAGLKIIGTQAADTLSGGAGVDQIFGQSGDDVLSGLGAEDHLDGGAGTDTAAYLGQRDQYSLGAILTGGSAGFQVIGWPTREGTDTLVNIERLRFTDTKVALDLDGNAGTVARILGAVFGAPMLQNQAFVGIGLSLADTGLSSEQLMQLALDVRLGQGVRSAQVVELLYTNIVGVAPDADTMASFVQLIEGGTFTNAGLGVYAAETDYNAEHIGLAGLAQTGIAYL
nr:Ig-like domain-containing protein [Ramlibacter lithotrophicus]